MQPVIKMDGEEGFRKPAIDPSRPSQPLWPWPGFNLLPPELGWAGGVGCPGLSGQSGIGLLPVAVAGCGAVVLGVLGSWALQLLSGAPLGFLLPQDSFLEAVGSGLRLGWDARPWPRGSSLEMTLGSPQGLEGSLWAWELESPPGRGDRF